MGKESVIVDQSGQPLVSSVVAKPTDPTLLPLKVGRMVHYADVTQAKGGAVLTVSPALVVDAGPDGVCSLVVWDKKGHSGLMEGVPYQRGDVYAHQHWSWPVRVY